VTCGDSVSPFLLMISHDIGLRFQFRKSPLPLLSAIVLFAIHALEARDTAIP
jgi:hypothetical protein